MNDSGSGPLVSVVIPSYGRDELLEHCISLVLTQEYRPFEVLVVHNGGEPFAYEDERVTVLNTKAPLGSPKAKNLGIQHSQGDYVAIIDDDAYPLDNRWLSQLLEPFRGDPLLGAVGGEIRNRGSANDSHDEVGKILYNSLGMYRILGNFSSPTDCDVDHLSSGNLAISRRALEEIRPPYFDPSFRGGAFREEVEFCVRLKSNGFRLMHIAGATVIHEAAPYGGNRKIGQVGGFWNGYGEATLFLKGFYRGDISEVLRFLVQESLFNWLPPRLQAAKLLGIITVIASQRKSSPRKTPPAGSE